LVLPRPRTGEMGRGWEMKAFKMTQPGRHRPVEVEQISDWGVHVAVAKNLVLAAMDRCRYCVRHRPCCFAPNLSHGTSRRGQGAGATAMQANPGVGDSHRHASGRRSGSRVAGWEAISASQTESRQGRAGET